MIVEIIKWFRFAREFPLCEIRQPWFQRPVRGDEEDEAVKDEEEENEQYEDEDKEGIVEGENKRSSLLRHPVLHTFGMSAALSG